MSSGDDVFTGEYFVSLKGYKIPHKSSDKGAFDVNNPPPPGTEDDIQLGNGTAYISPLALDKRPPLEKFEANPKITPNSNADAKTTKRSFLFMMPSAEGLPEELIKLFKPLCCDLCSAKLNSPSTARVHYESKNHEKKITSWLNSWTERTGEPLPKRQAVQGTKGPTGPNALHCDVCDLPLTSLQHAKQHEMGKKHKNAVAGRSKPSGPGYYDTNNKWVRTNRPDPSKTADEENPNRFQIGEAFLVQQKINTETVIVPESVLIEPPPPPPPPETFPDQTDELNRNITSNSQNSFDVCAADLVEPNDTANEAAELAMLSAPPLDLNKYCKLCDISVTSEMHMRLHLSGAKHAKKLRQLGEPPYTEEPHTLSQCISDDTMKRPKNCSSDGNGAVDYSVFRTPSGQYYCKACDLSVTSEVTLSQHFASKRHIKSVKRK